MTITKDRDVVNIVFYDGKCDGMPSRLVGKFVGQNEKVQMTG